MYRLPIFLNYLQRGVFVFIFIAGFIFPIGVFIGNALFKVVLSIPVLGAYVLNWVGSTLSTAQALVVAMLLLIIILLTVSNLDHRSRTWTKRIAHARGTKVAAKIVNVNVLYYEGQKAFRTAQVRFDFEIEHEGKTARLSTLEYGQTGSFDESIYPVGTKVSAKYYPSTGTMTCLDENDMIIRYV